MNNIDWEKYINHYEDLKQAGIDTKEKALEHWINHGQKEGRQFFNNNNTYNYVDFDWEKYINHYQDLKNSNIRSKKNAWNHWMNYGINENRIFFNLNNINNTCIKKTINLIGIVDEKCSVSDNLEMISSYFKISNNVNILNYKKLNTVVINELEEYVICLQPFEIKQIIWFLNKFTIKPAVFWIWEFKSLPKIFFDQQHLFSKIYVQSNFCKDVFSNFLSLNVEKVSLESKIFSIKNKIINYEITNEYIKNIFKNSQNKIKIGYCFDTNSSLVRKNVLNLVKAFNDFCKTNTNVVLILKYRLPRNGKFDSPQEEKIFNQIISFINNKNIFAINFELDELSIYKLYTCFDYYISPHIGEGYGLTIEENLLLGTKIISTYYSGEKDFLIPNNFYQLEHEEIEVPELKLHPVYGQMSNYTAAYVSEKSILKTLNNIFHDKNIPQDVYINNIYSDDNFIFVIDPKHSFDSFHYTVWSKSNIENILQIDKNLILNLKNFITNIDNLKLYKDDKKYFTFPPTFNRLHLHIVPINYISYRQLEELYDYEEIDQIYNNIQLINNINKQKDNSIKLELKFNIGIIIISDNKHINQINYLKEKHNFDYLVVIRKKSSDEFIENLIQNYKSINVHLLSNNLNNYHKFIKHDKLILL